jgi:DNA-binding NarL/FixJ family response regulator
MTSTPIRVGLIDDHALIREGLRRSFEREPDVEVVAEGANYAEGEQIIKDVAPDVIVVDLRLPDGHGLGLVRTARATHPNMGIVVLTMYAGDQQLFDALDAGASAFVPKSAPADEIVAAARHAASAPHSFSAADLADAMQRRFSAQTPRLSPRESEVLRLLADGLGIAQISRQLHISDSTTKTHVSKLYDKLGAGNRAQALMTALRLGLLEGMNPEEGPVPMN